MPPGDSAYGSMRVVTVSGPYSHERVTFPAATAPSPPLHAVPITPGAALMPFGSRYPAAGGAGAAGKTGSVCGVMPVFVTTEAVGDGGAVGVGAMVGVGATVGAAEAGMAVAVATGF